MKIKTLTLLFFIASAITTANAQYNIAAKGNRMIMGLGSFSSVNYFDESVRINTVALNGSFDKFYKDNMFIGINIGGLYQNISGLTQSAIAIGPEVGAVFGNEGSKAFPLLVGGAGVQLSGNSDKVINGGFYFNVGAGVIIPIQKNIGLIIQGKYEKSKEFSEQISPNSLSVNFGFVGILF